MLNGKQSRSRSVLPTDLDLCCLQRQDRSGFSRTTVKKIGCFKTEALGKSSNKLHCSAVITRSSGAMNTDRVIRGPRYTESFFNLETAVVQVGGFVITPPTCTTAGSSSYYEILHIACMLYYMFLFYLFIYLFFFIVETLCMYLA